MGPFIGVASVSTEKSLRIMNGAEAYDEWLFVAGRPRVLGKPGPTEVQGGPQPGGVGGIPQQAPGAPAPAPGGKN